MIDIGKFPHKKGNFQLGLEQDTETSSKCLCNLLNDLTHSVLAQAKRWGFAGILKAKTAALSKPAERSRDSVAEEILEEGREALGSSLSLDRDGTSASKVKPSQSPEQLDTSDGPNAARASSKVQLSSLRGKLLASLKRQSFEPETGQYSLLQSTLSDLWLSLEVTSWIVYRTYLSLFK